MANFHSWVRYTWVLSPRAYMLTTGPTTRLLPRYYAICISSQSIARSKKVLQTDRRYHSLQGLSHEFLDLAFALPLPPSFPPYSTTIILVTVFTRLVLTLPVSIWVRLFLMQRVLTDLLCIGQETGMEDTRNCHASYRKFETFGIPKCPAGNADSEGDWNERRNKSCAWKTGQRTGLVSTIH
jgi:hypothetical protein